MSNSIYVYDPTAKDPLSKVRGVGRYLQILREIFPDWNYVKELGIRNSKLEIFINPFFNFLQPPLTLRRVAKKQIAVIHDLIPLKYPEHFPAGVKGKLNIFLNKLALRNYDLVVTDSETSKRDIIKILGRDENKVKVIYPCLPEVFTQSKSEIRNPKSLPSRQAGETNSNFQNSNYQNKNVSSFDIRTSNFCLYVGDATWNKNLINLAKALKIINVTCVFVGKVFEILKQGSPDFIGVQDDKSGGTSEVEERSGKTSEVKLDHAWQRELKEFYEETKNDKRFIFLGYVPDDKLTQLYQQARCNILVSRDEGFGFSYLEAASLGCPSILSDIQVLHETSNDKGVLFANPNDPNDMANTVGEVYFNQDLRNKLGKEARERVKYFNQKKFVTEFLKILD